MFKAEYVDKEGYVNASFHPELLPHLINLREQFTKYALADVLHFKSEYTWRIYEMCMSVRSAKDKTLRISVAEFRERLAIPASYIFVNIKRTIKKAQAEIKTHTNFEVNVDYLKTGRAFTNLAFKITPKQKKNETALPA